MAKLLARNSLPLKPMLQALKAWLYFPGYEPPFGASAVQMYSGSPLASFPPVKDRYKTFDGCIQLRISAELFCRETDCSAPPQPILQPPRPWRVFPGCSPLLKPARQI